MSRPRLDDNPELVALIAAAIADPGRYVERIRDTAHRYMETQPRWTARAVLAALAERENAGVAR